MNIISGTNVGIQKKLICFQELNKFKVILEKYSYMMMLDHIPKFFI